MSVPARTMIRPSVNACVNTVVSCVGADGTAGVVSRTGSAVVVVAALTSVTGKLALAADASELSLPARVAVSAHVPLAFVTVTWSPVRIRM